VTLYRRAVFVFSALFVAIGVALLAVTVAEGGGVVGFVLGGLFIALGVGRIKLERRRGQ
jgi:dipeptide/tripeptide permease